MKLHTEITRQDYAEYNRYHFFQTKLKKTIFLGLLTLISIQLILNREHFELVETIVSTIVAITIFIFLLNRNLNKTKNIPDNNGTILGEKEYDFTVNNITYNTKDSKGTIEWSLIKYQKESPTTFYLYTDSIMAIIIPKRYFKNSQELDEFRELISQRIEKVNGI
jgi:hypothetical protein